MDLINMFDPVGVASGIIWTIAAGLQDGYFQRQTQQNETASFNHTTLERLVPQVATETVTSILETTVTATATAEAVPSISPDPFEIFQQILNSPTLHLLIVLFVILGLAAVFHFFFSGRQRAQRDNNDTTSANDTFSEERKALKEQIAALETRNTALKENAGKLKKTNTTLEQSNTNATSKIEELETANATLEQSNADLVTEKEDLERQINEASERNAALEDEVSQHGKKIEAITQESNASEEKIAELQDKNVDLTQSVEELKRKTASLEQSNSDLVAEKDSLEQQFNEALEKNASLEEDLSKRDAKIKELTQQLKETHLSHEQSDADLVTEKGELKKQLSQALEKIATLENNISQHEEKIIEVTQELRETTANLEQGANELVAEKDELENRFREANQKRRTRLLNWRRQVKELTEDNAHFKWMIAVIDSCLDDLAFREEAQMRDYDELEETLGSLIQVNGSLMMDITRQAIDEEAQMHDYKLLEETLASLEQVNGSLSMDVARLDIENEEQAETISGQVNAITDLRNENSELRERTNARSEEIVGLQEHVARLEGENAERGDKISRQERALAVLNDESSDKNERINSQAEEIESLQEQLKETGRVANEESLTAQNAKLNSRLREHILHEHLHIAKNGWDSAAQFKPLTSKSCFDNLWPEEDLKRKLRQVLDTVQEKENRAKILQAENDELSTSNKEWKLSYNYRRRQLLSTNNAEWKLKPEELKMILDKREDARTEERNRKALVEELRRTSFDWEPPSDESAAPAPARTQTGRDAESTIGEIEPLGPDTGVEQADLERWEPVWVEIRQVIRDVMKAQNQRDVNEFLDQLVQKYSDVLEPDYGIRQQAPLPPDAPTMRVGPTIYRDIGDPKNKGVHWEAGEEGGLPIVAFKPHVKFEGTGEDHTKPGEPTGNMMVAEVPHGHHQIQPRNVQLFYDENLNAFVQHLRGGKKNLFQDRAGLVLLKRLDSDGNEEPLESNETALEAEQQEDTTIEGADADSSSREGSVDSDIEINLGFQGDFGDVRDWAISNGSYETRDGTRANSTTSVQEQSTEPADVSNDGENDIPVSPRTRPDDDISKRDEPKGGDDDDGSDHGPENDGNAGAERIREEVAVSEPASPGASRPAVNPADIALPLSAGIDNDRRSSFNPSASAFVPFTPTTPWSEDITDRPRTAPSTLDTPFQTSVAIPTGPRSMRPENRFGPRGRGFSVPRGPRNSSGARGGQRAASVAVPNPDAEFEREVARARGNLLNSGHVEDSPAYREFLACTYRAHGRQVPWAAEQQASAATEDVTTSAATTTAPSQNANTTVPVEDAAPGAAPQTNDSDSEKGEQEPSQPNCEATQASDAELIESAAIAPASQADPETQALGQDIQADQAQNAAVPDGKEEQSATKAETAEETKTSLEKAAAEWEEKLARHVQEGMTTLPVLRMFRSQVYANHGVEVPGGQMSEIRIPSVSAQDASLPSVNGGAAQPSTAAAITSPSTTQQASRIPTGPRQAQARGPNGQRNQESRGSQGARGGSLNGNNRGAQNNRGSGIPQNGGRGRESNPHGSNTPRGGHSGGYQGGPRGGGPRGGRGGDRGGRGGNRGHGGQRGGRGRGGQN